ncbi:MAG: carbohydrate ABC transporter permease [Vicinamibacterales bacterium]
MRQTNRQRASAAARDARIGWMLAAPAMAAIALVALLPMAWTLWESLHVHDLAMPWIGRPLVGLSNYSEALRDRRMWDAAAHTAFFVAVSVSLELAGGLLLAVMLDRLVHLRGVVRTIVLLPWAIPMVVAALTWRFIFESPGGLATVVSVKLGMTPPVWFAAPLAAWFPLILADVWKTTPFVALLLLAGLQNIDRSLYEAASMDGADAWRQFVGVTLPLLRPTLLVALLFRALDAFRVFDVVYVMTNGGPGTATEPLALYAFTTLLRNLRFGYGSALSVLMFAVAFGLALAAIRLIDRGVIGSGPA